MGIIQSSNDERSVTNKICLDYDFFDFMNNVI